MLPLSTDTQKLVYIHKLKSVSSETSASTWYHPFFSSALIMPFLYPGRPLFLQLSHCGTADWATSLCHKALSVGARSQLAESFPSVKRPRFLHALVVRLFHPNLTLTQSHPVYRSIVGGSDLAPSLCGSGPKKQHAPSYVWSQPRQEVLLFSSPLILFSLAISVLSVRPPEAAKPVYRPLSTRLRGTWSSKTVHN